MKIIYLKNNEIDYKAYDFCVENSSQGTIYAMSWYLDIVSPAWELLMADDYNYVMPIPVKKKYFFKYAMQPLVCQQLGVFSLKKLTFDIFNSFINHIPYMYCRFYLNSGNVFEEQPKSHLLNNYELNLNFSYDDIKTKYGKNCTRNIKKAEKENLVLETRTDINDYISVLKDNTLNKRLLERIERLVAIIKETEKFGTEIWNIREESGDVCAIAPLIRWKNRVYDLAPVSTQIGKQKYAMFFLIDRYIKAQSENDLILDFEGSVIPGVAQFYKGFGAELKLYPYFYKKIFYKKM